MTYSEERDKSVGEAMQRLSALFDDSEVFESMKGSIRKELEQVYSEGREDGLDDGYP
jgi:hypothetical protein